MKLVVVALSPEISTAMEKTQTPCICNVSLWWMVQRQNVLFRTCNTISITYRTSTGASWLSWLHRCWGSEWQSHHFTKQLLEDRVQLVGLWDIHRANGHAPCTPFLPSSEDDKVWGMHRQILRQTFSQEVYSDWIPQRQRHTVSIPDGIRLCW